MSDTLSLLTALREMAFDMANSGKFGEYPHDENFNNSVESGFSEDGSMWTAEDGTTITFDDIQNKRAGR